ncbi:MAG: hypothetical protein Q9190_003194 [Brigantiaea leucoxantha]
MRDFVLYDFILVYELKLMLQILHTSDSVSQLTDPKAILTGSEEPGAPFSRFQSLSGAPAGRDLIRYIVALPENSEKFTAHIAAINAALHGPGIALVDLKFSDADSEYLQDLVLGLGENHNHGPPITHSSTRGWFWDVTPKQAAAHHARSESHLNFPWHTDCSYESHPPQFFALHVLHADRHGGGTLSALNVARILGKLRPTAYESLRRDEFRIRVPPEFAKGLDSIAGCLVGTVKEEPDLRIRFRSDIIQPQSERASDALKALNQILSLGREADVQDVQLNLSPEMLPDNTIVLMDNGRWLHARTEVRDPRRHLRRIRWGRQEFLAYSPRKATRSEEGLD